MMVEVAVHDAIGMRLAHDLTQILPGEFKGRLFQRGHLITSADIPKLLDIGKEHIYVLTVGEEDIHEDDAAQQMAEALMGQGMYLTSPHEGKVSLKAELQGLVKIDEHIVHEINRIGEIALATIKTNTVVQPNSLIAATRAIPLVVPKQKVEQVVEICKQYRLSTGQSPITIKSIPSKQIGLITTGSEVYNGRIRDKFGPAVQRKVEALGSNIAEQRLAPDNRQKIIEEIHAFVAKGYDMIIVTGGMSVDPDDRTPGAIKEAGADIVSYGTPMLPGSMLLMGYINGIPIMGLPGCVMHDPYTSFDVLLPRVLLGEVIEREDIIKLGYGGLLGC